MIDADAFLTDWSRAAPEAERSLAEAFLAPAHAGRRYLMGRNEHARALAEVMDIAAFVDDFAGGGTEWHGKPLLRSQDVPPGAILVNCALSQRPLSAWRSASAACSHSTLNYADVWRAAPDIVPVPAFVSDMRQDIAQSAERWRALHAALEDDLSRTVLKDLMQFRLTGDPRFMRNYAWRVSEQYFDPVASPAPEAVFVDVGGFDGDTAEAFCERHPDYRRVHVFEPSSANMELAQARLAGRRDIVLHACGAAGSAGVVRFDPARGSASAPSASGAVEIEVAAIDAAVPEPADFIKMDIEGGEFDALQGSVRQISAHAPTLALAVYHQACDFWRLWAFIAAVRADYRIYLRHYTEGWAETVMYFVARERA